MRSEVAKQWGERAVRQALATGVLNQIWRGVFVRADDSLKLPTRAKAALLAVGDHAVLGAQTSLALHGISVVDSETIHVTVPFTRRVKSKPALTVHQAAYRATDVIELDELLMFPMDLALAEFLCDGDEATAFAAMDQALAALPEQHRAKLREHVSDRLDERRDRRGVHRARMLLDLATGLADSPPESFFRLLVVQAGFLVPEPQYKISTVDGRLLYVLEMAWPEKWIALEYDGFAAREERRDYDAERDARMAGRGWITVRASATDLGDPSRVLGELRKAFQRRSG